MSMKFPSLLGPEQDMTVWSKLQPGTIFVFQDKPYLRIHGGVMSLDTFQEVYHLREDTKVQPIRTIGRWIDSKSNSVMLLDGWYVKGGYEL